MTPYRFDLKKIAGRASALAWDTNSRVQLDISLAIAERLERIAEVMEATKKADAPTPSPGQQVHPAIQLLRVMEELDKQPTATPNAERGT